MTIAASAGLSTRRGCTVFSRTHRPRPSSRHFTVRGAFPWSFESIRSPPFANAVYARAISSGEAPSPPRAIEKYAFSRCLEPFGAGSTPRSHAVWRTFAGPSRLESCA